MNIPSPEPAPEADPQNAAPSQDMVHIAFTVPAAQLEVASQVLSGLLEALNTAKDKASSDIQEQKAGAPGTMAPDQDQFNSEMTKDLTMMRGR